MTSHLVVALVGSVLVMSVAGIGAGIPYAAQIHDAGQIPTLLGAALVYLPAIWLFAGLAAALYGLIPRATAAAWAVLAVCFVVGFLGDVLKLPHWIIELSPFQHTPRLPAARFQPGPLIALLAIATALTATGISAFRHRDLG
jgi:ABC-2 type transport system permease protein